MKEEEKFRAIHSIDVEKIKSNISKIPGGIRANKNRYDFALTLNSLLEEREMEQTDFADRTNIADATISQYRNGKREPKLSFLVRMAKELNVSLDYLCGLNEYESSNQTYINISNITGLSHEAIKVLEECNSMNMDDLIKIINFLVEQEILTILNTRMVFGVDEKSKNYTKYKRILEKKDYIPIIDIIRTYFYKSLNKEEIIYINNSSIKYKNDIHNLSKSITEQKTMYTSDKITSKEIIDFTYFKKLEENLKRASIKYESYLKNGVDN